MVDVVFDTDEQLHFKGKKVPVESGTGFVNFVGLIKAVCRHDQNNLNSERFWKRLEPEISKLDSKLINKSLYISPSAVDKLVEQNATSCKKTWGVFNDDGYQQFSRDLKLCRHGKYSVSTSIDMKKKRNVCSPRLVEPESSKKVRVLLPEDDTIKQEQVTEFLQAREHVLNEREKSIQEREKVISSRELALSNREILMIQREIEYAEKLKKVEKEQTRLDKKKTEMGDPDMSTFFEQISSLTNKYKARRQASRRNSSDEEDNNRSPTPEEEEVVINSDDDEEEIPVMTYDESQKKTKKTEKTEKKQENKKHNKDSPTPSRSPSPIPQGSPERTVTPSQNTLDKSKSNKTEKSTPVSQKK